MMIALVSVAVVIVAALHTWTLRDQRRRYETHLDAQADRMHTLLAAKDPDLEQIIALVDRLCQRIQAPTQAVIDHSIATVPVESPAAVGFDDDEGFHAARENLTKEQLADMMMDAEVAGVAS